MCVGESVTATLVCVFRVVSLVRAVELHSITSAILPPQYYQTNTDNTQLLISYLTPFSKQFKAVHINALNKAFDGIDYGILLRKVEYCDIYKSHLSLLNHK